MKGYPVQFNVYAETQEEADRASAAIKGFISSQAQRGVAVTAAKLTEAVRKWGDNFIVTSYFR
ncbi:MAG: hypothetical protein IK076_01965 [Bacteroidales bacterium]|nr:hypothetical protein [Bacteroidales bacterium]